MAGTIVAVGASHAVHERWREGLTMALYIACSLLALLLVQPGSVAELRLQPSLLFVTGAGLVAAHLLAFSVSTRMVSAGRLDREALTVRAIQAGSGLGVSLLGAVSLALTPPALGATFTSGGLFSLIALAGFAAARVSGASLLRASLYTVVVVSAFGGVLLIKGSAPH